jgi:hypothetical protein
MQHNHKILRDDKKKLKHNQWDNTNKVLFDDKQEV